MLLMENPFCIFFINLLFCEVIVRSKDSARNGTLQEDGTVGQEINLLLLISLKKVAFVHQLIEGMNFYGIDIPIFLSSSNYVCLDIEEKCNYRQ